MTVARKISYWAKNNARKARLLIAVIKLSLVLIACYLGITLNGMGIFLPANTILPVLGLLVLTAALFYPSGQTNYTRQKICDFTLAACSFIMFVTVTSTQENSISSPSRIYGRSIMVSHPPTAEEILKSLPGRDKSSLTRVEKRILKKEFSRQLKIFTKATIKGDSQKAGEAWKIILLIIGVLGLLLLLSALVCTLSCNGSAAGAIVVAILGLAGVIWLTAILIKRINHGPKTKTTQ